ncbi:hypothetical protein [Vulgatibacter sp.]|uniref:hypothetical protein n=1 Tax=Vulgatibacter sp. TaxID=1971226 RepID=UPI00356677C0
MRRFAPLLLCPVLLAGCGETSVAPFGQLRSPVALAVHRPTSQVFIASLGGDELRVFDAREQAFLTAPVALFPLSVPTVRNPTALSAADRFVFVLSGPDAELGFVDTEVPAGAAGPRSVDVAGFPLTLPLDTVPADVEAFAAAWPWGPDAVLADHAIVAGLDADGEGGVLVAVRPPVVADATEVLELPQPEAVLELPGIYPAAIALDPTPAAVAGLRGADGAPVEDCRPMAIADGRFAPGTDHTPGIWLTSVRVQPDGVLSIDPLDESRFVAIEVAVRLPDGAEELRVAPVRDLAFVPAPLTDSALAALAVDPCAARSGRIYAVLDPVYCAGAVECPDVAVVDVAGTDAPRLAPDALEAGPALYDLPATMLAVTAVSGPFDLPQAFIPGRFTDAGVNEPLDASAALGLFASSNGSVYYVDGGLGPYLVGPGPEDRAPVGPAFPVDAEQAGPGISLPLVRTDAGLRGSAASDPALAVPPGARPRDERWTLAYLAALPGLGNLGRTADITEDGRVPAPPGTNFLAPVAARASSDPRLADRVAPLTFTNAVCEGFPVTEVASDGSFLRVDLASTLQNDEGCFETTLPLRLLPPIEEPWWVSGATVGFVGRLAGASEEAQPTSLVFVGDSFQFAFTAPAETPPERATYGFSTTDGLRFYGANPGEFGELPAAMASFLRAGPRENADPDWRIFVAYSGTDTLASLRPAAPDDIDFFQ